MERSYNDGGDEARQLKNRASPHEALHPTDFEYFEFRFDATYQLTAADAARRPTLETVADRLSAAPVTMQKGRVAMALPASFEEAASSRKR